MSSEPPDKTQEANQVELVGSTEPEQKPTKPARRSRTYADATDITIKFLENTLERVCLERDATIAKLEQALREETTARLDQINACQALAVREAKLETENRNLHRELIRNRWIDTIAAILIGVGGASVSFTIDPYAKTVAIVFVILGAGFLLLNTFSSSLAARIVQWTKPTNSAN